MNRNSFKYIILSLSLAALSCSRQVEEVFDTPATERVLKVLDDCQRTLKASKDGWILNYTAPDGYNAKFIMKFGNHDSLQTFADFSSIFTYSTYSLNYGQGPVLSFDTYGQLHTMSDPEISPAGTGHGGDFEFIIQSVSPDSIILSGRKNRDTVILHKASAGETNRIRLMKQMDIDRDNNINFFHIIAVGGAKADIMLSDDKKKAEVTVADKTTISSELIFSDEGFDLATPVTIGGISVSKFVWNGTSKKFVTNGTSTIEGSNSMTFASAATADQALGYYFDLMAVSPAMASYYNTLHTAFPNYRQSEVYLNTPTKFETISIRIANGDTTVVSRDTVSTSLTSYSFLFNKANVGTIWNNFKGSKITKLRDDQILLTQGIREGENANDLNLNKTVRNIPLSFYNTLGQTVYIRNSNIYLVSMKDSKSWIKLRKKVSPPLQTSYKVVP